MILYADDAQKAAAEKARSQFETTTGGKAKTAIEKLDAFWRAEDYHQKFYLRQLTSVASELRSLFDDERSFVDSTAVARLNGYVGGNGAEDDFRRDLPLSGLSKESRRELAQRLGVEAEK